MKSFIMVAALINLAACSNGAANASAAESTSNEYQPVSVQQAAVNQNATCHWFLYDKANGKTNRRQILETRMAPFTKTLATAPYNCIIDKEETKNSVKVRVIMCTNYRSPIIIEGAGCDVGSSDTSKWMKVGNKSFAIGCEYQ